MKQIYQLTSDESALVNEANVVLQTTLKTIAKLRKLPANGTFDFDTQSFYVASAPQEASK